MIAFRTEDGFAFGFRTAGIARHAGHVLLHRAEHDDFWALPGGRVEQRETAKTALIREMEEELSATVTVGPLLMAIENHFHFKGAYHQELGLYFELHLPDHLKDITRTYAGWEDHGYKLIFRWFPIAQLADYEVRPVALVKALAAAVDTPQHIINTDL